MSDFTMVLLWDCCGIAVEVVWYTCEVAVVLLQDSCRIAVGLALFLMAFAGRFLKASSPRTVVYKLEGAESVPPPGDAIQYRQDLNR